MRERRLLQLPPILDLLFPKAVEVVMPRKLDRRMKRREALHEDLAFDIAATGAPGDLGEQLKGALARAEIGQVQAEVGIHDADERDVRKVQALRDHLRADEDVDLAGPKRSERFAIRIATLHHVGIHPLHDGLWERVSRRRPRLSPCRCRCI